MYITDFANKVRTILKILLFEWQSKLAFQCELSLRLEF